MLSGKFFKVFYTRLIIMLHEVWLIIGNSNKKGQMCCRSYISVENRQKSPKKESA